MRHYTNETLEAITLEARRLFSVDLPIMFVDSIPGYKGAYGLYHLPTKTIYVRKIGSILKMVETLMHEIVHAKQHKLGILKVYDGKLFFRDKLVMSDDWSYEDQPWEIQANKYMTPMFDKFCKEAPKSLLEALAVSELRHHRICA